MTRTVQQLFDLTGKTALVTGGSGGVGLQLAYALGEAGARIMLTARQADGLEQAVADLQSAGIDARWVAADDTQEADLCRLVDETLHRMGDVHILVNHAASAWGAPAAGDAPQALVRGLARQVHAYFFLSQRVAQQSMMARRQGRIIHVAPRADTTATEAVTHLTRTMAAEWRSHNITVNAICPGAFASQPPGDDDDLKGACVLFAAEAGQHITGQWLVVGA